MPDILIYTAVFGSRDELRIPESEDYDVKFFTDDEMYEDTKGALVSPLPIPGDPRRSARFMKIMPQIFFPEYKRWIWIDGNVSIGDGVSQRFLNQIPGPLATFKHRVRECPYDEADACSLLKLDDQEVIRTQMEGYLKQGFPAKSGLGETGVILRDNTPEIQRFNRSWWKEVSTKSLRDQLSFNYVAWKAGLPIHYMGIFEVSPFFILRSHAPSVDSDK